MDPLERGDEFERAGDIVFEQVAAARPRAAVEQPEHIRCVDVLGEDEHSDLWELFPDPGRSDKTFVGVGGRHAYVSQRHVGLSLLDKTQQFVRIGGGAADLESLVAEQPSQPLA